MAGTEREVAFRKQRRDYTKRTKKNHIREGTKITVKKQERFIRPESLVSKNRQLQTDKKKFLANTKRPVSKNFPQPSEEDKIALVVRVTPKKEYLCKEVRTILTEYRLNDQFDGVFVALTQENRQKLKSIAHTIVYGVPTVEFIRQLIHTRAFTVKDNNEIAINSNKLVSEALSDKGLECLDDMVHSISSADDNATAVAAFLAPFHFNKIDVSKPRLLASQGGISGWTADIQDFISKII
ncbi:ribosomal protein, putative [Trichomonas vaginalis G3]|uniref:Ribosomal protein, putative n=1 Tax=Trichomonas vaginalis (strain ATCC PRA-98 / G3) TaxID=412133 RepID=A2DSI8_TRIV3|nr:maturation of LSU-rRNA from tricistronic rRNA transcript (SSU-rRNA, 5.8S rRNA, LSU-rRNA) [Trichomonas vaginalis G3]EAY16568.1 ribosomal protein, putative [Trichomonas vaginalis G3]KAI5532937.1 maturation of LSU-rRNA from tricistronic rRNA transcript (SSU-rRNA, 5.8S rRNA, LSU-rRNA) [Trichomonas vaginalis G3]|eukprot:XP_001328791.1 ribosomal protein [Trichomonas vaginalis G3]